MAKRSRTAAKASGPAASAKAKRGKKAAPAAAKEKTKYSPTYRTASNVARVAIKLLMPPKQMTFAEVRRTVPEDLSEKTIERYVGALGKVFDGRERVPRLEVERFDEKRKLLRLVETGADGGGRDDLEGLRVALAMEMLTAIQGSHLERDVREILKKFSRSVSPSTAAKLETLPRKFHSIGQGTKRYEGAARDRLNQILRCLLEQQRMRVAYRSQDGGGELHEYDFDPYTLATYKGGLYLIGYSFKREDEVYLAVERIEKVEPVVEDGRPYLFEYPETYSPEKFTEGAFGIFSGPTKTAVTLRVRNPKTLTYLRPRTIHPTQKLVERPDGTALLTMTVRGTEELATWVMGMAPWVEVLEPGSLREQVRERLAEGLRVHDGEPAGD